MSVQVGAVDVEGKERPVPSGSVVIVSDDYDPSASEKRRIRHKFGHAFVLCDQAIVSGSNFLTSIALARGLLLSDFGQYSLIWMSVLFGINIQMAILISPMMSVGVLQTRVSQKTYLGSVFTHQLLYTIASTTLLGLALIVLHVTVNLVPRTFIVPLACANATYQLQDFARRVLFYSGKTFAAVANDCISYIGQLAWIGVLFYKHVLSVPSVLWINGATSAAALIVASPFLPLPVVSRPMLRVVFRRNWKSAQYLLGATLLQWTSGNLFTVVTPMFLGAGAAGVMRACQSITNITNVWLQGLENSLPTEASHTLREKGSDGLRNYIKRSSAILLGFTGVVALAVMVAPELWLRLLYGEHLRGYGFMLRAYAALSLGIMATLPLRAGLRALEQTRPILLGYVATTSYSLISAPLLAKLWGLNGVAWGVVGPQIILVPILLIALRDRLRMQGSP